MHVLKRENGTKTGVTAFTVSRQLKNAAIINIHSVYIESKFILNCFNLVQNVWMTVWMLYGKTRRANVFIHKKNI